MPITSNNESTLQLLEGMHKTGSQLALELRRHNFQFGFREDGGVIGSHKEKQQQEQKLKEIYEQQK